jgi:RING finger/CHY zinc finger protein 1
VNARKSSSGVVMAAAAAIAAMEFYENFSEEEGMEHNDEQRINKKDLYGVKSTDDDNGRSAESSFIVSRSSRTADANNNAMMSMDYNKEGPSNNSSVLYQQSLAVLAATAYYEGQNSLKTLEFSKLLENQRPKCSHYERNCTIIAACCGMAFGCRLCHDECEVLPPPIFDMQKDVEEKLAVESEASASAVSAKMRRAMSMPVQNVFEESFPEHHNINRFAIAEVICRQCYTRQPSKTNNCRACGIQFGEYHCVTCNLWMSDTESPYHCSDCGFCRVGGRENFKHCFDCGMCIDATLFNDHNCKLGKYMSNCPVCQEDLFSSRSASHEMPCGHAIHWHCFLEMTNFDSRCPICKKTAESHERMAPTWNAMAMAIALQPVPAEMAKVVSILCSDCEVRQENRSWHFFGVQCQYCTSFNTVVLETKLSGIPAAEFLAERARMERDDVRSLNEPIEGGVQNLDLAIDSLAIRGGEPMDNDDTHDHHMSN